MDGQDGVAGIVLVREQGPELGLRDVRLEAAGGGIDLGADAFALGRKLDQDLELLFLVADPLEELDVLLEDLLLLLQGLGGLLVLPDLGGRETGVDRSELGVLVVEVKENLGPLRSWRRGR
jgi:hypothetical protein